MAKYTVVTGLNYAGKRAEPGDVVADLPGKSVRWLLEQGHITPVGAAPAEVATSAEVAG